MKVLEGSERCEVCGKGNAVVACDGCEVHLCVNCRHFDLWGYGCGHVDTKVFCRSCYDDIDINPYGGKLPD